jgi:hypothetical protein
MMRDVSLRGLEESEDSHDGEKKEPDSLGVGIGLRAPKEGVEFFHRRARGSTEDREMQSVKFGKENAACFDRRRF